MKLHTRILIGLAAGVAIGAAARSVPALAAGVEWLEPAGTIFIRLITMVVLPLVIASLFVGVTSLGDIRRLGRIGGRTLAYFLITTVLAAIIGMAVALVARVGTGLDPGGPRLDRQPFQCARLAATSGQRCSDICPDDCGDGSAEPDRGGRSGRPPGRHLHGHRLWRRGDDDE